MKEQPNPQTTKRSLLSMQVCVPEDWTDEQITKFAETDNPCGTTNGWIIRKKGDPALSGHPERVKCLEREGCIHVMLDA